MDQKRLMELAGIEGTVIEEKFRVTEESEKNVMNAFIIYSLFLVEQTHIWHLQTRSFEEHTAIGMFYEGLSGLTDRLAENFMGVDDNIRVVEVPALRDYSRDLLVSTIGQYGEMTSNAINAVKENGNLTVVLEEISACASKTLYLLKLQ